MTSNFPLVKVNYSPLRVKKSRSDDMDPLVTWVVLIASRDGFCNPLKPNSQDYTKPN
jgi:hypothetical protein